MNNKLFNFAFFSILCLYSTNIFAQRKNPSGQTNTNAQNGAKTWIVTKPGYGRNSQPEIEITSIEQTASATIVSFVYTNLIGVDARTGICNTFKIEANGKRVASFMKVENAPVHDVSQYFTCIDKDGKLVKKGEKLAFQVYFTPMPNDLKTIDLIEYNGRESCEYDVYSIDIQQKIRTKTDTKTDTKTEKITEKITKNEKQITNNKLGGLSVDVKQPANTEQPPVVSIQKKTLSVKTKNVDIEIWDNDKEDGDIITLKLNGKIILENKEVKKEHFKTTLTLTSGENVLVMQAVSIGTKGNNTAAFMVNDGVSPPQTRVLNSDMGKSEAIKINVSN